MGVAGMHYLGITCIVSYNLIIRLEWGGEQLHYLLSLQWPSLGAKGGSDLSRQCNIYGIVLEHSNREVAIIIQVNDGLHAIEKFVRSPLLPSRVSYFPGVSILLGVPCCCCLAFTLDDGLPGNVSVYICTQLKLGYLLLLFFFFSGYLSESQALRCCSKEAQQTQAFSSENIHEPLPSWI